MNDLSLHCLLKFSNDFVEPKGLPLEQAHDHRIPPKEENQPINLRPYNFPSMEKMIASCQRKGIAKIICPNCNPYSFPIILVKKKDQSWRLCIYFRALNKQTIKDKFLIPVIEELLDELYGSKVFSKIDLWLGYHQILMYKRDIYKIAFRTHKVHYEFVVMRSV